MAVMNPPIFLQSQLHPADRWRRALRAAMGQRGGVVAGGLAVSQHAGTPNMSVDVAEGMVAVLGTESTYQGTYLCEAQGVTVVTIAASDPTNPRRDLIIARVRDTSYSGASDTFALEVVQGTPAASPADPALPTGSCWVLARVAVAAAASSIVNANVTDFRTGGTGYTGQGGAAAALGGVIACTSAVRPTAGLYEGMIAFETDTDRVIMYDGSAWGPVAAGFQSAVTNYNTTTSLASTGASISLPPGKWMVMAKGEAGNVGGTVVGFSFQLWNATASAAIDSTELFFGSAVADRRCWSMMAPLTIASTSTIQVRALSGAGGASYTVNNIKLIAVSVSSIV